MSADSRDQAVADGNLSLPSPGDSGPAAGGAESNSVRTTRDVEMDQLDGNNDPSPSVVVNLDPATANLPPPTQFCPTDRDDSADFSDKYSPEVARKNGSISDERCYGPVRNFSEFNFAFLEGKIVFGPQVHQLVGSIVLATFPLILQTVCYGSELHQALHVVTWLGYLTTVVSLLICGGTNPGIVPKRYHPVNCSVKQQVPLPDGRTVGIRYCYSCCVYRGPRTHHCGICDNCVDQFDHHCPWTGTCIGWRNYSPFIVFLHALNLTAILLVIFAVLTTCNVSAAKREGVLDAMRELNWAPAIILGYVFLAVNSVTGLLLVHWYLMIHNLTTAEHLKATFADSRNMWDLGCYSNIASRMVGRIDPYIDSARYRFKLIEVVRKMIAMTAREQEQEEEDESLTTSRSKM